MTNKEIESKYIQLLNLKEHSSIKFPGKVAYAIVRNYRTLIPIYQDIINVRQIILNKYGKPDENKGEGYYSFDTEENAKLAQKELQELDNVDTQFEIQKIKFSDIENMSLFIEEMDAIYFMLEDE